MIIYESIFKWGDVKPQLEKEVFEPLKNKEVFINSCTILNDTLAWDIAGNRDTTKCIDIAPDMLYERERVTEIIA